MESIAGPGGAAWPRRLARAGFVRLRVLAATEAADDRSPWFDVHVTVLFALGGSHELVWSRRGEAGGAYLCTLRTGNGVIDRHSSLVK